MCHHPNSPWWPQEPGVGAAGHSLCLGLGATRLARARGVPCPGLVKLLVDSGPCGFAKHMQASLSCGFWKAQEEDSASAPPATS